MAAQQIPKGPQVTTTRQRILVDQNLYGELAKVGFTTATLNSVNSRFNDVVGPVASIVDGLTTSQANDVVQWTIDYSMGLAGGPRSIFEGVNVPVEVGNTTPGGPVEALRGVLTSATISRGVRERDGVVGQSAFAQRTMSSATVTGFPLAIESFHPTPMVTQSILSTEHLLLYRGKTILNIPDVDNRPDWQKHPNFYAFPVGFPRTQAEVQISVQTMALLRTFAIRSGNISKAMTTEVRNALPGWKIPDAKGINWQDENARFGYLNGCDKALLNADDGSATILQKSLQSFMHEGEELLVNTTKYVPADPTIFEKYFDNQLRKVIFDGFDNIHKYMSRQRYAVDNLKTQLSKLDFDQQKAAAAAAAAQQQESGSCSDIFSKPLFWEVVLIAPVAAVAVLLIALSGPVQYDPYPPSGSYGPSQPLPGQ